MTLDDVERRIVSLGFRPLKHEGQLVGWDMDGVDKDAVVLDPDNEVDAYILDAMNVKRPVRVEWMGSNERP